MLGVQCQQVKGMSSNRKGEGATRSKIRQARNKESKNTIHCVCLFDGLCQLNCALHATSRKIQLVVSKFDLNECVLLFLQHFKNMFLHLLSKFPLQFLYFNCFYLYASLFSQLYDLRQARESQNDNTAPHTVLAEAQWQ